MAVLPKAEAYCGATPTECVPFFGSVVSSDDEDRVRAADQLVGLDRELTLQRRLVPDPVRHKMMQLVVIARRHPLGHRPDALAVARPDQPRHIERTHPPPRLVAKPSHERRQPPPKLVPPIRHPQRSPNQSAKPPINSVNKPLICQSSARVRTQLG